MGMAMEIKTVKNNLLIIGAGSHGKVVFEIAHSMCRFEKIEFLDDFSNFAIGKIKELENFKDEFNFVIPAIGNREIRINLFKSIKNIGYKIPIIFHESAYISKTAQIEEGVIILPNSTINTNVRVGKGSIIDIGTKIDHDVFIGEFCHIKPGSIIGPYSILHNGTITKVGQIIQKE